MVEITLPCCDATTLMDADADEVRCAGCGLAHELAPDAREVAASAQPLPLAA